MSNVKPLRAKKTTKVIQAPELDQKLNGETEDQLKKQLEDQLKIENPEIIQDPEIKETEKDEVCKPDMKYIRAYGSTKWINIKTGQIYDTLSEIK